MWTSANLSWSARTSLSGTNRLPSNKGPLILLTSTFLQFKVDCRRRRRRASLMHTYGFVISILISNCVYIYIYMCIQICTISSSSTLMFVHIVHDCESTAYSLSPVRSITLGSILQRCMLKALRIVINPHSHLVKRAWNSGIMIPGSLRVSNRSSKVDVLLWCIGRLGGCFETRPMLISADCWAKIENMDAGLTSPIRTKHGICSFQRPRNWYIFQVMDHTRRNAFTRFCRQVIVI